jgi:large repetitive protein
MEINGQRLFGPVANGIWAGDYQVTVYGAGECPTTEEFHVGTDIYVYNGVSPNGDGRNDVFTVGCIDMFRDNHVRIYNRSGQLVYEMNDYNNEDRSFAGVGNRGIYLDSRNVPDGTYFYVIDKRDGSKAISGYLELIR